ncbi:glutamine synthetase family protein [Pseudonocardia humida]|uniref:Glutamine synthetase n=1 Tax=Pseudonocardia humida TaxID=2800819 RepID=A0ABT1A0L1_9PSEU|nr:glutamine synthetase family protein [Pseudonocardia humida]MCO1656478.1 glutamine synthetase [Pseudonocardia humida]
MRESGTRSSDERPVAAGGAGAGARPLLAGDRGGFVDRHDLWSDEQYAAAAQLRRVVDELGLEMVRVCFTDQHGVLRGKTLTRAALPGALRSGISAPSSLLLKDTAGRTTYPVFEALALDGHAGFSGAGDVVLVPDPTTFRVLPWSPRTGLLLADLRYPDGRAVPFCTRTLLRSQLARLGEHDLALTVGTELEFHVLAPADGPLDALDADRTSRPGRPGAAAAVRPTTPGAQLLKADTLDAVDGLVEELHRGLTLLDLPLRSIELEFGPSQFEITLDAGDAAKVADDVVLCRTAVKQVCRRQGLHATFMSRPLGADTASAGWHLHQSLRRAATAEPVFAATGPGEPLSATGMAWMAGLLEHAAAATAFTTPTVNGYKRYLPHSLAPDRVLWGRDNRGAMVRVVTPPGAAGGHLENRCGEPAANPYLYILSQVVCGLDGVGRGLVPGPPSDSPYADGAPRLPGTLGEAVAALEASTVFRRALGDAVVDWYAHLKRAEFARYLAEVSDWEQREYFDLL